MSTIAVAFNKQKRKRKKYITSSSYGFFQGAKRNEKQQAVSGTEFLSVFSGLLFEVFCSLSPLYIQPTGNPFLSQSKFIGECMKFEINNDFLVKNFDAFDSPASVFKSYTNQCTVSHRKSLWNFQDSSTGVLCRDIRN